MSRVAVAEPSRGPKVLTLEEIEQQMMATAEPPRQPTPTAPQPQREATPVQMPSLAGSGYAAQQALLDSMFPELGAPSIPGQQTAALQPGTARPSVEETERIEVLHQRITEKIVAMARYNNLMGSSDKDFITRIQLSQLASADPYASDFYAQVFSALKRSRMAAANGEGSTVVQVAPGFGLGAAGPAGNRFGKMGSNTMQKLSTQVKKLVENRTAHQKVMGPGAQTRSYTYSYADVRSRSARGSWSRQSRPWSCSTTRSFRPGRQQARTAARERPQSADRSTSPSSSSEAGHVRVGGAV